MKTALLALALSASVAGAALAQEKKAAPKAPQSTAQNAQKDAKPSGYFVTQGSKAIDVSKKDLRIQNALYSEYND